MAKYEKRFTGNFDEVLHWLHRDITQGSVSATYEDGSDYSIEPARIAVRVYERYSMVGGNRVSMSITLAGIDQELWMTAITSGGSRAVFFKINTLGEEAFLIQCKDSIERYISKRK